MGMDLTLCPFKHGPRQWTGSHLSYTRLDFERDYDLFAQVSNEVMGKQSKAKQVCKPFPIPPNVEFMWYGDEGLKARRDDPYGEQLTYVEAGQLAKINVENSCQWNKGIIAMMKELNPATPVILWWH